jgi:hypothetical protein
MKRTLLCCLTLLAASSLYADDDTQLRLNQSLDQNLLQQQHQLQQQGTILILRNYLVFLSMVKFLR